MVIPPLPPLDFIDPLYLIKLAQGVKSRRDGSILSRSFILKSEFRIDRREAPLEAVNLRGATSFRYAGSLGVYGCAQPTKTGLRTVLSVLKSKNTVDENGLKKLGKETIWFSTREEPIVYIGAQPFVLRDSAHPTKTYSLSATGENIEAIELRLKDDILREAARYGDMILVQEEIGENEIQSTWLSASARTVRTVRELWSEVALDFNVIFHRVPIAPDQSPQDGYLDNFTSILATVPTSSSLVFNCGLGKTRTTLGMTAALIVRRKQMMLEGRKDPYEVKDIEQGINSPAVGETAVTIMMRTRLIEARRDRSLLRLMTVLQKTDQFASGLPESESQKILGLLSSNPQLLENLRDALIGQFDIVSSLLSVLDHGSEQKLVVDTVVDECDTLLNLRESILFNRIKHASTISTGDGTARKFRQKGLAALDRYFFLIAFAAFVDHQSDLSTPSEISFSRWLKSRSEIGKMIARMRKDGGQYFVFSPINDLSVIASSTGSNIITSSANVEGNVIGSEFAAQIVKDRSGIILRSSTILKNDQWQSTEPENESVGGVINFRRVKGSNLYGLSQPTEVGITHVLENIQQTGASKLVWINLREEPIIFINSVPYCLRNEAVSLRNIKSYAGISASRLELLEDRLKADILAELSTFDSRILLHTETSDGQICAIWETVTDPANIKTLREVMDGLKVDFHRIPVTAEKAPDFHDVKEIVAIVSALEENSSIIVNCQLGRGRTTRTLVLITLIQEYLQSSTGFPKSILPSRPSYTVINNLLRTIRSGQEIKAWVDSAITKCGSVYDLLDEIEKALELTEVSRGIQCLRSYYFLILFAAFLNEAKVETLKEMNDYETFVTTRPVFKTIERELDNATIDALIPLNGTASSASELVGNALKSEVESFVSTRSGRVLSANTLLKSDFFSGLQKLSLPEKIVGVPNFRQIHLLFGDTAETGPLVFGSGMPTEEGLRKGLKRMGGKSHKVVWISMREEPVILINGKPHVLRLITDPFENVVQTGITTDIVEAMESALKLDLVNEARQNGGKVLLHDEIESADGTYQLTALWETIQPDSIQTPREIYESMSKDGLSVDYERLPVTDEQSPIPSTYEFIETKVMKILTGSTSFNSNAVLNGAADGGISIVFSCQMGRGRTTTGQVSASLVANILFNPSIITEMSTAADTYSWGENSLSWDGRDDPFIEGEYKIILNLVKVLQHGKLAKKLTDRAINSMEAVQNIRKAIYDYKVRAEAQDVGSKKQIKMTSVAINYLYRYGTLIVFANYLLEKKASESQVSFPEWYAAHREIERILKKSSLE